jgi:hypothetical protein
MSDGGSGSKVGGGSTVDVIVSFLGIFFFYFWFSIAQHDMYAKQEDGTRFSHTSLQLFAMILVNCVGAVLANYVLGPLLGTGTSMGHSAPVFSLREVTNPYSWLSIGLCCYGAMDSSNRSLGSLSYPIMVLGKSCKMVPVMLAGVLINGTKYPAVKYVSVFIVTIGIVVVNLYGERKEDNTATEIFPLLLLVLSLILDAVVGPRQEHHRDNCKKKGTPLSPWESMFKTNLASLVWVRWWCEYDGREKRVSAGSKGDWRAGGRPAAAVEAFGGTLMCVCARQLTCVRGF